MIRCMQRTNIYLEPRQTAALDRIAADLGVSRAEVIRQIVDRAVGGADDNLAADLAAIEESFGAAPQIEAPRREAGARQDHLDEIWSHGR